MIASKKVNGIATEKMSVGTSIEWIFARRGLDVRSWVEAAFCFNFA
jgi:hypothetical protein